MKILKSEFQGVRLALLGALAAVMAVVPACYPDSPSVVGELDMVVTSYDSTFNYSANLRYAMRDTVIEIHFDSLQEDTLDHSRDKEIIDRRSASLAVELDDTRSRSLRWAQRRPRKISS